MATRKMTDRAAEAWLSEPVTVHLFRDNGSYKEDKIVTVNGETVNYNETGKYWAFYIDGEYAQTGVDSTPVTAGATYTFKVE